MLGHLGSRVFLNKGSGRRTRLLGQEHSREQEYGDQSSHAGNAGRSRLALASRIKKVAALPRNRDREFGGIRCMSRLKYSATGSDFGRASVQLNLKKVA